MNTHKKKGLTNEVYQYKPCHKAMQGVKDGDQRKFTTKKCNQKLIAVSAKLL